MTSDKRGRQVFADLAASFYQLDVAAGGNHHVVVVLLFPPPPITVATSATRQAVAHVRDSRPVAIAQPVAREAAVARRVACAIDKSALPAQRTVCRLRSMAPVGDATFCESLIQERDAAPDTIAADCAITECGATGVAGDRGIRAAKPFVLRKKTLVKPDGAECE